MTTTRVIHGVPFHHWIDRWHTNEGRYTIFQDQFALAFCNQPHPDHDNELCPGFREHPYLAWSVKDTWEDEYPVGRDHKRLSDAVLALKGLWDVKKQQLNDDIKRWTADNRTGPTVVSTYPDGGKGYVVPAWIDVD